MVTLFCAVVGGQGSAFPVDIEASKSVGHLKEAIQKKKEKTITCDPDELKLFLAKKGDAWLDNEGAAAVMLDEERRAVIEDENGRPQRFQHMKETWDVVDYFGKSFKRKRGEIHVLVVVPPVDNELWDEQRARKKAKSLTAIEEENMKSIADALNIDMWHIGGIALAIRHVEPDFPEWFYVRKETLDIIKIFNENMEKKLSTVFVGTPGVGKSMLVVLFAFYMALRQQKRVVLFRKQKGKGFSMLYLDGKHKQYWRKEEAEIADLDLLENRDFELCLDGFAHNDITVQFARLARFRSLATSVQYPMKNDDTPVLRRCLVPFWSKMDLKAIGAHFQWTDHNIKKSYYYSGGNLRDFLSEKNVVIDSIDQAVGLVGAQVAELLNTQYALGSEKQIDRLRMTSVRVSEQNRKNHSRSAKYTMTRSWFCVITSEYALRQLGKIVAPSYYKELWSKGHMLGDDGLMGIAFENYVHTMARDGMKIELLVRAYDRRKKNQHTYAELEFKANSYRYEGTDAAECEAIMKQLADVDYWFPCTRCLETIDSVAKLNMGGRHDVVDLIQITNSDNYKIDSGALDKYVKLFPAGARYIALVPDKETSDKFRLAPADPPTEVPLYVAFVANWSS